LLKCEFFRITIRDQGDIEGGFIQEVCAREEEPNTGDSNLIPVHTQINVGIDITI
jgi:hypothetical protein